MKPIDLDAAISAQSAAVEAIRAALNLAGPVDGIILSPLHSRANILMLELVQFKVALYDYIVKTGEKL